MKVTIFWDPLASCFFLFFASWCGTHFAETFLFCYVWVTILKIEVVDMFASCAISSHDLRRSSSNKVLTITTDVSSVAVTGRPLLGSSWMLTDLHGNDMPTVTPCYDPLHYPRKPYYEFLLGFFPSQSFNFNVWLLITVRDLTPVSFFFHIKVQFCRTGTTLPANTHTMFFIEVWLTNVAKIRTTASSYWPGKRSLQNFWNDLRARYIQW
jgi:hypothetical protein